jgi:hypothetical protein
MTSKRVSIVLALLLAVLQVGCSMLPTSLCRFNKPAEPPATVKMNPWLSQSLDVPIPNSKLTLPELLQQPTVLAHRELLSAVAQQHKQTINSNDSFLSDDCIVLSRGTQHWYFLNPSDLIPLYAGEIQLRPNDRIDTLPFQATKFFNRERQEGLEYVVVELGRSPRKLVATGSTLAISSLVLASNHPPQSWWSVTVLSRHDGRHSHHLVLPAATEVGTAFSSAIEKSDLLIRLDKASLQPGDVIEMTNLAEFGRRF